MTATKSFAFRPALDALEDRSLMSVTAGWSGGVLSLTGSSAADRIHLRESGGRVTVDGFTGSVASSQIRQIRIDGKAGDDVVTLDLMSGTAAKASVVGGSGRDALIFGSRARPGGYSGFETYFDTATYSGERWKVDSWFPRIRGEFEVDNTSTGIYNCIAWSLGVTNKWINPPKSLAEADKLNGQYGYKRMSGLNFSLTPFTEKVALYALKDASGRITSFTHQARQLPDGSWTSKLGKGPLIRHVNPDALDGNGPDDYGVPVAVYSRFNPNFR
jgi:hypothetical protein